MEKQRIPWYALRLLAFSVVLLWGSYIVGIFRTAEFGLSARFFFGSFVISGIYVLGPAVVCLLGLPWRRVVTGMALALTLPTAIAEIPARLQERVFLAKYQDLPKEATGVYERRWWPFHGNTLHYNPQTGAWWGDC